MKKVIKEKKIGVGLYGSNGHTIDLLLQDHPGARLVAVAAFDPAWLPPSLQNDPAVRRYSELDDLLDDDKVELVSLCSPVRADQSAEAIRCMEAGKHVYAEKPCALSESDLDSLMAVSGKTGCKFHEMAGTAFEQPYLAMRAIVRSGQLGEIVQVHVQKSYPSNLEHRPQDERIDGGIICQAGVHGLRFIEHITGIMIKEICAVETARGNPVEDGGLKMAASVMMTLENGGVASMVVNYLNPPGFGQWGNEAVRVFGTNGFIEAMDGGSKTRMVIGDIDFGALQIREPPAEYFDFFVSELDGSGKMPMTLDEELHPTRMAIRAKISAGSQAITGRFIKC